MKPKLHNSVTFQKDTVKIRMKNTDPTYPPKIVWSCEDVNHVLYICIPENTSIAKTTDKRNDMLVATAEKYKNQSIIDFLD